MARLLASRYAEKLHLVLAARNATNLEAVAFDCRSLHSLVTTIPTDVSRPEQCRALIDQGVPAMGGLDVLINNAGVSAHALLHEVSAENMDWYEQVMRVNFWGSAWCTHAALPHLVEAQGRIVAVSSLAGLVGVPGRTAYSASKFAMGGFFEALRTELKPSGVSVTLAYPGVVNTHIRYRGYNAEGMTAGVSGLKEDKAMPVSECARLILDGMSQRKREVVMTAQGKLGRWLKLIAPSLVERMALAALADEIKTN